MWGNRLGWMISAVLWAAAGMLLYQLYALGQPTPSTGDLATATSHPFELYTFARPLLPDPEPAGDAGDDYRKAIADYDADPTAYDELAKTSKYHPDVVKRLPALKALLDAADRPAMDLYKSHPELIVNYEQTVPSLNGLETVGKAAANVSALAAYEKDYKTARTYSRAVLALGANLYRERVTFGELESGLSMLSSGAAGLEDVAKKAGEDAAAPAALDRARLAEYEYLKKSWTILSGQSEANIAAHAGDFLALADDAKVDPVWRTEAVRRLGRLQRNADRKADQVQAKRVLRQMADDKSLPPAVHTAAVRGRDITRYENQSAR